MVAQGPTQSQSSVSLSLQWHPRLGTPSNGVPWRQSHFTVGFEEGLGTHACNDFTLRTSSRSALDLLLMCVGYHSPVCDTSEDERNWWQEGPDLLRPLSPFTMQVFILKSVLPSVLIHEA